MTTQELLAAVASGKITPEEAAKLLPNGKGRQKITMKVSEKGALSVYGLGRFPTTLYVEQWERLLDDEQVKAMRDFIKANAAKLPRKRTQTALTTTRPAQHRARNQPAKPMTLTEVRKLLNSMVGKTVRLRTIEHVVVEIASDDWTSGIDLNAYLESLGKQYPEGTSPELIIVSECIRHTNEDEIHCVCKNEAELLEVLHDPAKGEWYFIDEGGIVTRRLA